MSDQTQPASDGAVSAVIAHYGPVALAEALVGDLLSQAGAPGLEVIVSDDASPTPFPPLPGVRIVRSETNGGYGAAINRGAILARNPWLLILNSDIRLEPTFVSEALQAANRLGPYVFGFKQRSPAGPSPSAAPLPKLLATLGQHSDAIQPLAKRMGWDRAWKWDAPNDVRVRPVGWVMGSALLLPRRAFLDVGGFDERFFMYSEEVDLQRRLRARGTPSILLGNISVDHVGAASTESIDRHVEQLRSRLLYQEIAYGKTSRRVLEIGLRLVVAGDTAYHRLRQVAGRSTARARLAAERNRALDLALNPEPQLRDSAEVQATKGSEDARSAQSRRKGG